MIEILLFFGAFLGIIHYFSERINIKKIHRMKAVSFSAGILITYLFLDLFPTLFETNVLFNRIYFVFVLVGFTIFHVLEKYIYQHSKTTKALKKELMEVHTISIFIYYLVIGMVLANIGMFVGLQEATLFFVPLLLHASLSSISFSGLHYAIRGNLTIRFLVSFSTLIGILAAIYIETIHTLHQALMGSIIGMLLYITIVDSIPKEREGNPEFFLLGIAVYAFIITLLLTL